MDYYDSISSLFYYGFSGTLMAIFAFGAIIGIALYVLKSLALMEMARSLNIEHPWLAWIPIADTFIMGKILGTFNHDTSYETNLGGNLKFNFSLQYQKPEYMIPLLYLLAIGGHLIPFVGRFVSTIAWLLFLVALYELYRLCRPKNALIYTVLSAIFVPLIPIFLFLNRKIQSSGQSIDL